MKSLRELPFVTDNGHEFYISWDKSKATIVCKFEHETEAFDNPIRLSDFEGMIESAATYGIRSIDFNCNYSIEVHRTQWASIGKKHNVKITRISN